MNFFTPSCVRRRHTRTTTAQTIAKETNFTILRDNAVSREGASCGAGCKWCSWPKDEAFCRKVLLWSIDDNLDQVHKATMESNIEVAENKTDHHAMTNLAL